MCVWVVNQCLHCDVKQAFRLVYHWYCRHSGCQRQTINPNAILCTEVPQYLEASGPCHPTCPLEDCGMACRFEPCALHEVNQCLRKE
jgi:hypothetical protein